LFQLAERVPEQSAPESVSILARRDPVTAQGGLPGKPTDQMSEQVGHASSRSAKSARHVARVRVSKTRVWYRGFV
jgi:hypothetical protein